MLDPTVVVHSSESTKTSDLTGIMPIQPKKLFHLDITREATTSPNGQPHVRVGAVLPKWWTLIAFEPTASMMLTDSQAAIAAYIFSETLDPSEELVISDEKGYRSTFRCLVPERCVKSRVNIEVINLVALMMTRVFRRRNEDPICWFMPEHFARYALSDKYTPAEVIFDFLGAYISLKISHVARVFIPICEELHWYLVIVDFTSRRLIILDSLPCVEKHQQRKRNAIKVATYLEVMLDDHIFDDDKFKVVDCSTFWPMTPFGLPTQKNRSNDSGVWVTSWMRECTLQDDINIQINDSTRMRLAVDLVLEEYNDLCLVIQENAWQ
ncbi:Ulp1 protease family, carboxy-terminal domain protein [Arachis hypogaea]|nr:Ulp1 protease family, carboxy-terminal domain protein [Arachis hypogaea]